MIVTIFYRNNFDGGDGWNYYPRTIQIADNCPQCGAKRGTPYNYNFCEDGEWFSVDKWDNPCGHLDTYGAVWHEAQAINRAAEAAKARADYSGKSEREYANMGKVSKG